MDNFNLESTREGVPASDTFHQKIPSSKKRYLHK